MVCRTHLSHYTNSELLRIVYNDNNASEQAVELAQRLEQLMDEFSAWDTDREDNDGSDTGRQS